MPVLELFTALFLVVNFRISNFCPSILKPGSFLNVLGQQARKDLQVPKTHSTMRDVCAVETDTLKLWNNLPPSFQCLGTVIVLKSTSS